MAGAGLLLTYTHSLVPIAERGVPISRRRIVFRRVFKPFLDCLIRIDSIDRLYLFVLQLFVDSKLRTLPDRNKKVLVA